MRRRQTRTRLWQPGAKGGSLIFARGRFSRLQAALELTPAYTLLFRPSFVPGTAQQRPTRYLDLHEREPGGYGTLLTGSNKALPPRAP